LTAGQFGDVWKGTFQGQQVAIKILRLYVTSDVSQHVKTILRETLIWRQLRHINVLPFLCLHHPENDSSRLGLVSPWMQNGNLREFLRRVSGENKLRLSLMLDVADGLDYLHSIQPRIIHGDLKAVNVLVTDEHRACLADFGLSTASDSQVLNLSSVSTKHAGGTLRWTSPELLEGVQPINTSSSDIYSFACVSYEIFSGLIPLHEIHDHAVIFQVIRGRRPSRPSICEPWEIACEDLGLDDETWAIIEDCWKTEPANRPVAKEVGAFLCSKLGRSRSNDESQNPVTANSPWGFHEFIQ